MQKIPGEFREKDMPVPAVFESDDNKQLNLIPTPGFYDKVTESWVEDEEIGLRVKFIGFKLWVFNKKIFELIINSGAFVNGDIRISSGDESGFWRQAGVVKIRTVQVVEAAGPVKPKLSDIDFKGIKPGAKVEPLVEVG